MPPIICTDCGEGFANADALHAHVMDRHSLRYVSARDRPKQRGPFACGHEGCQHSFASEGSAIQHRMAKHGIGRWRGQGRG